MVAGAGVDPNMGAGAGVDPKIGAEAWAGVDPKVLVGTGAGAEPKETAGAGAGPKETEGAVVGPNEGAGAEPKVKLEVVEAVLKGLEEGAGAALPNDGAAAWEPPNSGAVPGAP